MKTTGPRRQPAKVMTGGCACGAIRYQLTAPPLIVHACHCRDCQRITGSAFVINLWMESEAVVAEGLKPASYTLAGGTGKPHEVFFCPRCGVYLWSLYHGAPGDFRFVRAGTLDDARSITPDVHIFTRSKAHWLELPEGARAYKAFYPMAKVWSAESLARLQQNRSK
jgi:hypothetical protein